VWGRKGGMSEKLKGWKRGRVEGSGRRKGGRRRKLKGKRGRVDVYTNKK
jgi:hypothetical protein